MRPNRKKPEQASFWFQSLSIDIRPHGGLLQKEIFVEMHPKGLLDASNGYTKQFLFERSSNMADELIPMVLFVVIGFITIGFFHFNSKNRQSIMDTVQKAIDQGGELTPELLTKLGAAVNPRVRDMRRGIVFLGWLFNDELNLRP